MKKIWLGLLSLFMSVHLLGLSSFSIVAANKAITTTYAKAYDQNGNEVQLLENGDQFIIEAEEIEGMRFISWAYDGRVKIDDKEASKTSVRMGLKDTHIWANYTLVEPVWLNGVYLKPGYYLPSNSQELTREKPKQGGYAYYEKEGYLTLHNYQLEMMAPALDSVVTENYRYALRTYIPLFITLEGDNSIKMLNGDCVYVAIGGASGSYLTFDGDDDATLYAASGDDVGIRSIGGVTINGGHIYTEGLSSDRSSDIIVNGGSFTSTEIMTGHCNEFIVNAGIVNVDELYNITNVVVNGGSLTGAIFERVYNMKISSNVEGYGSTNRNGEDAVKFSTNDFASYNWFSVSGEDYVDMNQAYNITVENGYSSVYKATAGTRVIITAETPAAGYVFDQWIVSDNVSVGAPYEPKTKFIMPNGDVTIKAIFKPSLEIVRNVKASQKDYKTVELTWNEVDSATGYRIYRKTETSNDYTLYATSNTTTYKVIQTTGKEYKYKISAINEIVEGEQSSPVVIETELEGIPQLSIEKIGDTRFHLSWNKIDGATRYIIYRKRGNDSFKKVLTLGAQDLEYTTSEMPAGDYQFIVKAARYDSSNRVMSDSSNIVLATSIYKAPQIKVSAKVGQVTISWDKIEGVIYYEVYQSEDGKDFEKIKTTKSTNVTIKKLKTGKSYTYKVRGYKKYNDEKVYTPDSSTKTVKIK